MCRTTTTLLASLVLLALTLPASATVVYYDFGDDLSAGNYNNITHTTTNIANCVASDGALTGIALEVHDAFYPTSANPNGTTAPTGDAAIFNSQSTRDSLYGNTAPWYDTVAPTGGVRLSGLNPALTYDFTVFASRTGSSDNREAQYVVTGLNSGVDYLNASSNVSEIAFIGGIMPTAAGEITLDVSKGPNNDNSYGFFYIGAVQMSFVPEPASLVLLVLGGMVALRRR
ncbi:MAG: PEP-CTERM sorting domain-containing protein [Phycisphaerales bacterium]|nr:PEP-CTERM sorting domain-containing protein [Phycisphaerales bacterium]